MDNLPFVSVIIPCRNEEKFIGKCLDSIIANDYPKDKVEISVVDGMSEDGTREIAARYNKAFAEIEELITPVEGNDVKAAYHIYVIQLRTEMIKVGRKEIFEALRAENIGVNVHCMPVYYHPYYQKLGYQRGLCPKAEKYYEEAITLPLFPRMTDEDVKDVIKAVRKIVVYSRS